jgi:hypothetical protein
MPGVRRSSVHRMKIFFTVALLTLSATSSFAQQALANKPPKAFGPVKTITYEYNSVTFSRDKTRIAEGVSNGRTVVWLFTPQGRLLTSEIFEPDGRPSGTKSIYKYDSAGRLTSILNYLLGPLSITETFSYPDSRHVKIVNTFESNKDSVIEIDEYDHKGNVTKAKFQDSEGTTTEFYKYDDKGNPTEFVSTYGTGNVWIRETYQYEFDFHGNWTTETDITSADSRLGIAPKRTIKRKIVYY